MYRARAEAESERLLLLRLIERDNPKLYLCYYCRKLKPLSTYRALGGTGDVPRPVCRESRYTTFTHRSHVEIDYHDAKLALDRHMLGEPHGRSISTLSSYGTWELPGWSWLSGGRELDVTNVSSRRQWQYKRDTDAHVLNGQLFSRYRRHAWYPPHLRAALLSSDTGGAGRFGTCGHSEPPEEDLSTKLLDAMSRISLQVGQPRKVCSTPASRCTECPTEYTVTVFDHAHLGIEIVVESWQNWGRLRAPDDLGWINCIGIPSPWSLDERLDDPIYEELWRNRSPGDVPYFGDVANGLDWVPPIVPAIFDTGARTSSWVWTLQMWSYEISRRFSAYRNQVWLSATRQIQGSQPIVQTRTNSGWEADNKMLKMV